MNITKDVILDLLPLYEAGEASADTRALVDEFLAAHPDVARISASADAILKSSPAAGSEKDRRAALARTKAMLSRRHWFFGIALACTLTSFSFGFSGSTVFWFMWRDAPAMSLVFMGSAIASWVGYIWANRELKVAGM